MLIARELPPADWAQLAHTELGPVWALLNPATTRVLAVTDEAGRIVGCWALLAAWHLEGCWVDPAARGRGGVFRRLLTTMAAWVRETDAAAVLTAATDPAIAAYLTRLGAQPLPGQAYLWLREAMPSCRG